MRNWTKAILVVALLAVAAVGVRAQFMGKDSADASHSRPVNIPYFSEKIAADETLVISGPEGVYLIRRGHRPSKPGQLHYQGLEVIHHANKIAENGEPQKTILFLKD